MELISVHVPKTAGTAFTNTLVKNYGAGAIYRDYHYDKEKPIASGFRVVHGHFGVEKYVHVYPEARKIAWLRHPAAWAISFYYFAKRGPRIENQRLICELHDQNLSLIEFASHPVARNLATRFYLKGVRLEEYFFLGSQEHFEEDLTELGRELNWRHVLTQVDNANPEPGYKELVRAHYADAKLMRQLESLNHLDMATYETALKLREKRRKTRRPIAGRIFSKGLQTLQSRFRLPRAA